MARTIQPNLDGSAFQALDLAMDSMASIFSSSADMADVEGVLNIVTFMLSKVLARNAAPANVALVDKFIAKVTSDAKQCPVVRLKM